MHENKPNVPSVVGMPGAAPSETSRKVVGFQRLHGEPLGPETGHTTAASSTATRRLDSSASGSVVANLAMTSPAARFVADDNVASCAIKPAGHDIGV